MNDPFTGPTSSQYNAQYNMYQSNGAAFGYNSTNGYPVPPPPMYGPSMPVFNSGGGYLTTPPPMYGNYDQSVLSYARTNYAQSFNHSQSSVGSPYGARALTQYHHPNYQHGDNEQDISGSFSQLTVTGTANPPVAVPIFALRNEVGQPIPPQFVIEQNAHVGVLHISHVSLADKLTFNFLLLTGVVRTHSLCALTRCWSA
jgi:hypothetical protein